MLVHFPRIGRGSLTYHHRQLNAAPNERSDLRVRRHIGVYDGTKTSDGRQERVQSTRETPAFPLSVDIVKFGSENQNSVCVRHIPQFLQLMALIMVQDTLESENSVL